MKIEQPSEPIPPPTSEPIPTDPQPNQPKDYSSNYLFSTPSSITLTIPKICAFPEDTPTPPSPPSKPNLIEAPVFNTFMENIRNNIPSTPDSYDQPIVISSNTKMES